MHNMKKCGISVDQWDTVAGDRTKWRAGIKQGVELFEVKRFAAMGKRRATRKNRLQQQQAGAGGGDPSFVCGVCQRVCHSRIGLVSHSSTHRSELPTSSSSSQRDYDDYVRPVRVIRVSLLELLE